MSYAAEPYVQFVDDLLTSLTGGVARERFAFLPEEAPFQLSPPGPIVPSSVRVFGQAAGAYHRFRMGADFTLERGTIIDWNQAADGKPEADAVLPDEGTPFYVNYEHTGPTGVAPLLTDRNPGSVTRMLAESFAREYAVLSRQLEAVYQAGFLNTATGRDLDNLVALVGVVRRRSLFASGTVVFERNTPAPADIFIPAGTTLSTLDPPQVTFETTEDRTLRRGTLSAEVPIQSTRSGIEGLVTERSIGTIHRPILGISSVWNPQATRFTGAQETDEALRSRARRAFEGRGQSTTGALLSALTSVPGVREKDIRITEDYLLHPGVVELTVAGDFDDETQYQMAELVDEVRPAGVRVLHNLKRKMTAEESEQINEVENSGQPVLAIGTENNLFYVKIDARLIPEAFDLTQAERLELERQGRAIVHAFIAEAGIGEVLIHNRLVAQLMALDGVRDVMLQMRPRPAEGEAPPPISHSNILPALPTLRPAADDADVDVQVGGSRLVLDLVVNITLQGAGLIGDQATNLNHAQFDACNRLKEKLSRFGGSKTLTLQVLSGMLPDTETYQVEPISYTAEYVDAGIQLLEPNLELKLSGLEQVIIRGFSLAEQEVET